MDMVRGEGIEDDILKKNKKSLMGIISRVFDNEFSKGAERSHVAKKLDTLAMAGHMFTYEQRHHIVLGMAVASAKEMRAVARTRDGAAYINDVFSTFIKTAPEMRGRLGEVRAWVFSEEKPEALADRLIGTIGTAGKQ